MGLTQLALWALSAGALAQAANPSLTLRVVGTGVTAGDSAQIQVYADSPALIAQGVLGLDLDPTVFGPIASVAAFSANGDAIGLAVVNGTHVEASFSSPSGGIGQLPGVPVFVVRAPVLTTPGGSGAFVSLSFPASPPAYPLLGNQSYPEGAWADPAGNPYAVNLVSGRIYPGIGPLISDITPGGGLHPAGTVLHIDGTRFEPSATVTADGLAISSVQFVSSSRIDVTLGGSRELTGLRFQVANTPSQVNGYFFAAPPSALSPLGQPASNGPVLDNIHAILPFAESRSTVGSGPGAVAVVLLNPTDNPVDVLVREVGFPGNPISGKTLTVPPGNIRYLSRTGSGGSIFVDANSPLRIARYYGNNSGTGIATADPSSFGPPPLQVFPSPSDIVIDYQTGGPNPTPRTIRVSYGTTGIQDATVQVNAGAWLKVTTRKDTLFSDLDLAFDTSGLSPGVYSGTITVTPVVPSSLMGFAAQSSTIHITLDVDPRPTISVQLTHTSVSNVTGFDPTSMSLSSNGSPAAFTIAATTASGGNWLSTDITSGVTPATVNIKANPGSLAGGTYTGQLLVEAR